MGISEGAEVGEAVGALLGELVGIGDGFLVHTLLVGAVVQTLLVGALVHTLVLQDKFYPKFARKEIFT